MQNRMNHKVSKNLTKNFFTKFIICSFIFSIFSCSSFEDFISVDCPYVASEAEIICEAKDSVCEFAYAKFDFYNKKDIPVKSLRFSFRFYDEEGEIPFAGDNLVQADLSSEIAGKSKEEILISLDDFIYASVPENLQADYLYIEKISYADGSTWTDKWGIYAN